MTANRKVKIGLVAIALGLVTPACAIGAQTTTDYKTFAQWCQNLSKCFYL
jgi:hypothetical protein